MWIYYCTACDPGLSHLQAGLWMVKWHTLLCSAVKVWGPGRRYNGTTVPDLLPSLHPWPRGYLTFNLQSWNQSCFFSPYWKENIRLLKNWQSVTIFQCPFLSYVCTYQRTKAVSFKQGNPMYASHCIQQGLLPSKCVEDCSWPALTAIKQCCAHPYSTMKLGTERTVRKHLQLVCAWGSVLGFWVCFGARHVPCSVYTGQAVFWAVPWGSVSCEIPSYSRRLRGHGMRLGLN